MNNTKRKLQPKWQSILKYKRQLKQVTLYLFMNKHKYRIWEKFIKIVKKILKKRRNFNRNVEIYK